mmetsp:Transcript_7277/g.17128  ORF Transcript_7277/g.17128 Transcript_7277/m.17128 type:complete len:200 (-) Transcript_7277:444-1043(-)
MAANAGASASESFVSPSIFPSFSALSSTSSTSILRWPCIELVLSTSSFSSSFCLSSSSSFDPDGTSSLLVVVDSPFDSSSLDAFSLSSLSACSTVGDWGVACGVSWIPASSSTGGAGRKASEIGGGATSPFSFAFASSSLKTTGAEYFNTLFSVTIVMGKGCFRGGSSDCSVSSVLSCTSNTSRTISFFWTTGRFWAMV